MRPNCLIATRRRQGPPLNRRMSLRERTQNIVTHLRVITNLGNMVKGNMAFKYRENEKI